MDENPSDKKHDDNTWVAEHLEAQRSRIAVLEEKVSALSEISRLIIEATPYQVKYGWLRDELRKIAEQHAEATRQRPPALDSPSEDAFGAIIDMAIAATMTAILVKQERTT